MSRYLLDHLRGRQPLARAFWLNGVAFGTVLALAAAAVARAGSGLDDVPRLALSLGRDAVLALAAAWSLTGIWNTASAAAGSGARGVPAGAKLAVLVAAIGGLHFLLTTVPGRVSVLAARLDPALADYVIARTAADEVSFHGALNDRSVRELAAELTRPGVKVLRIESHGGLILPVMELAEVVAARRIAVAAAGRCLSSCPLLLAASPNAVVFPGTRIAFHRPVPATLKESTDKAALALAAATWHARYRDYGIAPAAVAEMARHEVWEPGLGALAEMGLIKFVLDGHPARLTPARDWCRDHAAECAAYADAGR